MLMGPTSAISSRRVITAPPLKTYHTPPRPHTVATPPLHNGASNVDADGAYVSDTFTTCNYNPRPSKPITLRPARSQHVAHTIHTQRFQCPPARLFTVLVAVLVARIHQQVPVHIAIAEQVSACASFQIAVLALRITCSFRTPTCP
jgi:hypothetical protein